MPTPTNDQLSATLLPIGTTRRLAVVIVFDRAGSSIQVTPNGTCTHGNVTGPNYTVTYTCGSGANTPTVVAVDSDVTNALNGGTTVFLNQSLSVVLEETPDRWVKCT